MFVGRVEATYRFVRGHTILVVIHHPNKLGKVTGECGTDKGSSPLEYILAALCVLANVSAARLADNIRFTYDSFEPEAVGELDTRGRKGLADLPVHYQKVRLTIKIKTDESGKKLERLKELVAKYCPVDSLIKAAAPDYQVIWERVV